MNDAIRKALEICPVEFGDEDDVKSLLVNDDGVIELWEGPSRAHGTVESYIWQAASSDLDHCIPVWMEWLKENLPSAPSGWLISSGVIEPWLRDGKPLIESIAEVVCSLKENDQ